MLKTLKKNRKKKKKSGAKTSGKAGTRSTLDCIIWYVLPHSKVGLQRARFRDQGIHSDGTSAGLSLLLVPQRFYCT